MRPSPRTRPVSVIRKPTRHDDHRHIATLQCASFLPLLHRPRRRLLAAATPTVKEEAFADQRTAIRWLSFRSATASSPIIASNRPAATRTPRPQRPNPHSAGTAPSLPRVPSLEAFGRRPSAGQHVDGRHPKPFTNSDIGRSTKHRMPGSAICAAYRMPAPFRPPMIAPADAEPFRKNTAGLPSGAGILTQAPSRPASAPVHRSVHALPFGK